MKIEIGLAVYAWMLFKISKKQIVLQYNSKLFFPNGQTGKIFPKQILFR